MNHRPPDRTASVARPLIATASQALLEELLAVCASVGITPIVAADAVALARGWSSATVVLLDAEQAARAAHLHARPRVVIVGAAGDPLWDVAAGVGADHVAVLPSALPWLAGLLSSPAGRGGALAPVLCVIAGHGGGGATTLAVALGRRAASRGLQTLLVDADPYGGGMDLALGLETADGDRWPQVMARQAQDVVPGFIDRLPGRGPLRVLSGDRLDPAAGALETGLSAVLTQGRRQCELVIVDLPRRIDALTEPALAVALRTYVVLSAQVRAVASAATLIAALGERCADVQAVLHGPAPGGLTPAGIARSLRVPLAASLRAEPGLIRDYERGVPPGQARGPLAKACDALLKGLPGRATGAVEADGAAA